MKRALVLAALLTVVAAAGCVGDSPEEQLRAAQQCPPGDRACEGGSPEHRPGQACLACHGPDFQSAGLQFEVAGTIYLRAGDAEGVSGAEVTVHDADGHDFSVLTNRTGNFMVSIDSTLDVPRDRGRGVAQIPWALRYPLEVKVEASDRERAMRSRIQREGSCAKCHTDPVSATSAGRIFVLAP
jgi:cytochrome c553